MKNSTIALIAILAGCGNAEDEKEAPKLGDHEGDEESCGGAQPVIETASCDNTGLQYNEDEGREVPTVTFYTHVTDTDADLTSYRLQLQFDDILDSSLSSSAGNLEVTGTTSSGECDVDDADLSVTLFLKGGPPEYGETHEFFITVTDANAVSSEAFLLECTMPNSDGS